MMKISALSGLHLCLKTVVYLVILSNVRTEDSKRDAGISTCTVSRSTSGDGFHRELSTSVTIESMQFGFTPDANAEIAVVETIPSSMYLDLYQIAMLEDFGGPKIYSASDIDVEKPAYDSMTHTVYVYGTPVIQDSAAHLNITIPVHLRYNRPSSDTESYQIMLPLPMILIRFYDGPWLGGMGHMIPSPLSNGTEAYWSIAKCKPGGGGGSVKFVVPVGQAQHSMPVVIGTLLVTIGATLYLCVVIIRQRGSASTENKDTKQE